MRRAAAIPHLLVAHVQRLRFQLLLLLLLVGAAPVQRRAPLAVKEGSLVRRDQVVQLQLPRS